MSRKRRRLGERYGYGPPLDALLDWGAARLEEDWPSYYKLPFALEHVPDLLRMAADSRLRNLDSGKESWAPMHAMRVIGQLGAVEAAPALLLFLALASGDHDYFLSDEVPLVFAMLGAGAVPHLALFLADEEVPTDSRGLAGLSLSLIGAAHAECCEIAGAVLTTQLRRWETNDPELNASLLVSLSQLPEPPGEVLELARAAYEADRVDEFAGGDWMECQDEMDVENPVPLDREDGADWWDLQRQSLAARRAAQEEPEEEAPLLEAYGERPGGSNWVAPRAPRRARRKAAAASRRANRARH